ncbi:uncharacterized protein N7473_005139 [Penicillium subrubescens]|uniref:uncharacterized protein n=1 Tax=Penicillium subrubescens TaxID=1316194 RepID=UPI0025452439|nr:uncharacterized protein N7473_005139 [Penicillium subrubescens]KAJ5895740.1 hypothetical protein N7473_005139 [Penicillium subrubescens]
MDTHLAAYRVSKRSHWAARKKKKQGLGRQGTPADYRLQTAPELQLYNGTAGRFAEKLILGTLLYILSDPSTEYGG